MGTDRWAQAGGHRQVGTGKWAQARGHRQVGTGTRAEACKPHRLILRTRGRARGRDGQRFAESGRGPSMTKCYTKTHNFQEVIY